MKMKAENKFEKIPKVFISYAWSTPEHQKNVENLARRLVSDGIEVMLDMWDLSFGCDKYVFMEQCVTDATLDKVLIICDQSYTEKADMRRGGVGDETAIISPQIYGKSRQEKFLPIVFGVDNDGNPWMPAYLKSRKYVRAINGEFNNSEYEDLVCEIYGIKLRPKPSVGSIPSFVKTESIVQKTQKKCIGSRSLRMGDMIKEIHKLKDITITSIHIMASGTMSYIPILYKILSVNLMFNSVIHVYFRLGTTKERHDFLSQYDKLWDDLRKKYNNTCIKFYYINDFYLSFGGLIINQEQGCIGFYRRNDNVTSVQGNKYILVNKNSLVGSFLIKSFLDFFHNKESFTSIKNCVKNYNKK